MRLDLTNIVRVVWWLRFMIHIATCILTVSACYVFQWWVRWVCCWVHLNSVQLVFSWELLPAPCLKDLGNLLMLFKGLCLIIYIGNFAICCLIVFTKYFIWTYYWLLLWFRFRIFIISPLTHQNAHVPTIMSLFRISVLVVTYIFSTSSIYVCFTMLQ